MGLFDRFKSKKNAGGVIPFEDFTLVLKTYIVDSLFTIGLPAGWEPYPSDRFRAKTQDGKTHISITNWKFNSDNKPLDRQELEAIILPLYEKFVTEGAYEPYDDLIVNDTYISKSFKVDEETQYYLTTINKSGESFYQTGFIIRNIGDYNPQLRAALLNIVASMKFV